MIAPPNRKLNILYGKEEICRAFQIGEKRLRKWRDRGMPVKLIDGRLTGHYEAIENFIRIWVESCHKK